MVVTPETQARQIIDALRGRQDGWDWAQYVIAAAIKASANERLEAAAQAMEATADRYVSEAGSSDYDDDVNLLRELAGRTRSLKFKD